jgi:phenylalanyl-tRNA synthetase alpha chain
MATLEELTRLVSDHEAAFAQALAEADAVPATARAAAIEALTIGWTGRKSGRLADLMGHLPSLPPADRRAFGQLVNALKSRIEQALTDRALAAAATRRPAGAVDVTLPGRAPALGYRHPLSLVREEVQAIFTRLGYQVLEGPEIEDDWHNFSALNIPETHPARDMHDTFYIAGEGQPRVLRTHTSPVQIRTMQNQKPPIRIIAPGRVYRSDSDATHTPMFHQIEGLVIDKGIHMGHLKWTLETFLKAFFERDDIVLRLRPSYFPFTEPSAEVDVGWSIEKGRRVVGGSQGWMEVLGSGMVHPRVIANCGLDPAEWQGFAFGTGVDRLAMLKYGMDDLRAFFDGDLRWMKHYGFGFLDVPTLSGGVGA